jgi:hypothetical protein
MASHQLCHRVSDVGAEHNFPSRLYKGCTITLIHCGGQTDCPIYVGNVNSALIRKVKTARRDALQSVVWIVWCF